MDTEDLEELRQVVSSLGIEEFLEGLLRENARKGLLEVLEYLGKKALKEASKKALKEAQKWYQTKKKSRENQEEVDIVRE